jgi:hypothetical protein
MNISREFRPPLSPHYPKGRLRAGRLCRPAGRGIRSPSLLGKGAGVRSIALALLVVLALAIGAIAVYAQAGDGASASLARVCAAGAGSTGYTLSGGFWHAAPAGTAPGEAGAVYLPIIVKP